MRIFFSRAYLLTTRGQRGAEALLVGAALVGVDRVGEGVDALGVGRVPLHRDLDRHACSRVLGLEADDRLVDRVLGGVEVLDEVHEAAGVVEGALLDLGATGRRRRRLVDDRSTRSSRSDDGQALVEERHLLQPAADRLEVVVGGLEDRRRRPRR